MNEPKFKVGDEGYIILPERINYRFEYQIKFEIKEIIVNPVDFDWIDDYIASRCSLYIKKGENNE